MMSLRSSLSCKRDTAAGALLIAVSDAASLDIRQDSGIFKATVIRSVFASTSITSCFAICRRHLRAGSAQARDDGAADPAGGAGDQRLSPCEIHDHLPDQNAAAGGPNRLSSGQTPRPGPSGRLMWPASMRMPFRVSK